MVPRIVMHKNNEKGEILKKKFHKQFFEHLKYNISDSIFQHF